MAGGRQVIKRACVRAGVPDWLTLVRWMTVVGEVQVPGVGEGQQDEPRGGAGGVCEEGGRAEAEAWVLDWVLVWHGYGHERSVEGVEEQRQRQQQQRQPQQQQGWTVRVANDMSEMQPCSPSFSRC